MIHLGGERFKNMNRNTLKSCWKIIKWS